MKLDEILSEDIVKIGAEDLRKQARKAGEKLFGGSHSGLLLGDDISIKTLKQFTAHDSTYDTYQYIFDPKTGKGTDTADSKVKPEHAIDGVIYVGGADGITVVTLPGTEIKISGELKKKENLEGASWVVTDKNGYEYVLKPTRGFKPLSSDPEEALKQIQHQHGYSHVSNAVKVKKYDPKTYVYGGTK
jgi:hypothetical protein